jgi:hypothetical protein
MPPPARWVFPVDTFHLCSTATARPHVWPASTPAGWTNNPLAPHNTMPPKTATTPNRRPATKEESDQIVATARRALASGIPEEQVELLPAAYRPDFEQRLATLLAIEGGKSAERASSRFKALQATVSQVENDAALGLLTVEDSEPTSK